MKKENDLLKKLERKRKFLKILYDKVIMAFGSLLLFGTLAIAPVVLFCFNSFIAAVATFLAFEFVWCMMSFFVNEKFEEKVYNKMKSLEKQIVDFKEIKSEVAKTIERQNNEDLRMKTEPIKSSRSLIQKRINRNYARNKLNNNLNYSNVIIDSINDEQGL